jgi:hypothetical protein
MSRFKISSALMDRINHFATFPQTGGKSAGLRGRRCTPTRAYISALADPGSVVTADDPIWPTSVPGYTPESFRVLVRGAADTSVTSGCRAGPAARRSEPHAEYTKGERVVCPVVRGESTLSPSSVLVISHGFVETWSKLTLVQEIVTFPKPSLPPHIEDILRAHQNAFVHGPVPSSRTVWSPDPAGRASPRRRKTHRYIP